MRAQTVLSSQLETRTALLEHLVICAKRATILTWYDREILQVQTPEYFRCRSPHVGHHTLTEPGTVPHLVCRNALSNNLQTPGRRGFEFQFWGLNWSWCLKFSSRIIPESVAVLLWGSGGGEAFDRRCFCVRNRRQPFATVWTVCNHSR